MHESVRMDGVDQKIFTGGTISSTGGWASMNARSSFCPDGQIGAGRAENEISWKLTEVSGARVLTISRPDADISRMKLDE